MMSDSWRAINISITFESTDNILMGLNSQTNDGPASLAIAVTFATLHLNGKHGVVKQ